jgi:hypothetical protein
MRRLLFVLATLTCVVPAALTAQRQLTLLITVANDDGTELSGLTADDLRIMEDDVDCRLVTIEPAEQPLKIQVLVDNGVGMGSGHGILRDAVRAFVEAVPDGVEITLVTTSPRPRVLVRQTASRQEVLDGVERLARDSGGGRFSASLMEAAERISRDTPHSPVIVSVATPSGSDDMRDSDFRRMRERLRDSGATVYVVMYADVQGQVQGERQIEIGQLLAEASGGRFELLNSINGLARLLTEIAERATAATGGGAGRQFRVTFERPEGRSGELGRMQMASRAGLTVLSTKFE